MGLKGRPPNLQNCLRKPVEIRPRWDWKWALRKSELADFRNVEIRPRWDWKSVELSLVRGEGNVEIRPRWDWKSSQLQRGQTMTLQLKSDQDGIESFESAGTQRTAARWNQTKMGLKGHYMLLCRWIYNGWNQTKMGLKALAAEPWECRAAFVEIRPRWDWKTRLSYHTRTNLRGGWNQTKMGLKVNPWHFLHLPPGKVEIRPRWDWKVSSVTLLINIKSVEIRPRWDWK